MGLTLSVCLRPSKVIVYGPMRENYEVLLENVRTNGFGDIIKMMEDGALISACRL